MFSQDAVHTIQNLIAKNTTKSVSVYLVVVFALIITLACLPIVKIDISSQSRGVIRAKQDNTLLQTVVSGKVINYNLKNNLTVTQGDTLLVITTQQLQSKQNLNDSLLNYNQKLLADYKNLRLGKTANLKTQEVSQVFYAYNSQQQELQNKIAQAQLIFNRYQTLYNKKVIASAEYETHKFNLQFAKDALHSFTKQQHSGWETNIQNLQEQIQNLNSSSQQLQADAQNYVLTAPVSGTLENVVGLQKGSFIYASQAVGSISPNTQLIVENTVSPADIGLLKVGQQVQFQFDAFNYNQWGMLTGKVIEIDNNITTQENAAFFKVRCSLNSTQLQLKNGYKTQIGKGMTLTTRYFITRRSLLDLLFDKVDDWFNPKILTQ